MKLVTVICAVPLHEVSVTPAHIHYSQGRLQTDSAHKSEVRTKQTIRCNDEDDHQGIHGKYNTMKKTQPILHKGKPSL